MDRNSDSRARRRLRFSLATLFLLFTIILLLVAAWTMSRRLDEAATELQKYRDETGHLTISDRQQVHAIGVQVTGSLEWQWRVYLPEDRQFRLHLVTGEVPKTGAPGPGGAIGAYTPFHRSGEFLILAKVEKNARGSWVLAASTPDRKLSSPFQNDAWLDRGGYTISEIGPGKTESVPPGTPMVLLRLRVDEQGIAPETPCDGLMISIEEMETE